MINIFKLFIGYLLLVNMVLASEKLDKVSLQLHWKYQFEFAGFIAAKEMGFYEDEGFDVELKEYTFGMDVEGEVLSGRSSYGIYNSYILKSYLKGKPLKLMSSFFKKSALIIITKPNIKSLKDLVGRRVMSATKDDFIFNFSYMFHKENVDIDSLNLIPHTFNVDDFIDSNCDAMTAFISDQTFKLDQKSIDYNIINPSNYGVFGLQLELFTSKQNATKYPNRVEAFNRASIKGWKYALSHKDEIIDIIIKEYNKDLSYEFLSNEAKKIELLILPKMYSIGYIDKNFISRQAKSFQDNTNKNIHKSIENFIFNSTNTTPYLKKIEKKYLKNKNSLSVCVSLDNAPIEFMTKDKPLGISMDIIDVIRQQLKIDVDLVKTTSWKQSQEYLRDNKCDILPSAIKSVELSKYANFTEPYLSYDAVIVTKDDKAQINGLSSIVDKKMGSIINSIFSSKLKDKYQTVNVLNVKSYKDIFDSILDDEVYYSVVPLPVLSYYKNLLDYKHIQMAGYANMQYNFSMVTHKENTILLDILNKVLSNIDKTTKQSIYEKWTTYNFQYRVDYGMLYRISAIFFILLSIVIFFLYRERKLQLKVKNFNVTLQEKVRKEVLNNIEKDNYLLKQAKHAQMGEMISMIAHQWRQPLTAISATSGSLSLKAQLDNLDNETAIDCSEKISEITKYLSATINDFSNFFKANKEIVTTTCSNIVNSTLSIIDISIKDKNIKLVINDNCSDTIDIYENEVKQVLLNLLKNAEDVLIENSINNPVITIDIFDKSIIVRDNGGGVPEEYIDKLFDPYFSTKEKDGTGLGLYISKIIIEEHCHGFLKVENSDAGAIFKIVL